MAKFNLTTTVVIADVTPKISATLGAITKTANLKIRK